MTHDCDAVFAPMVSSLVLVRDRLVALLEPAGTVMDINIGAALWMAANGVGRAIGPDELCGDTGDGARQPGSDAVQVR